MKLDSNLRFVKKKKKTYDLFLVFLAKENVLISLYPVSKSRKYNDAGVFSLDNVCFSGGNC